MNINQKMKFFEWNLLQIKEQESKVKNPPVSNATDLAKLWCMCESAFGRAVLEVIEYLRSLVVSSADGHAKRPRTHRHQPVTPGHRTRSYNVSEEGGRGGSRRGGGERLTLSWMMDCAEMLCPAACRPYNTQRYSACTRTPRRARRARVRDIEMKKQPPTTLLRYWQRTTTPTQRST